MEYDFPTNWPKILFLIFCAAISTFSLYVRIRWKDKYTWIPRLPAKKQWPSIIISIGQFLAFLVLVWLTWSWYSSSTKEEASDFHKMGEYIHGLESKLTSTEESLMKIKYRKHDDVMKAELPMKLYAIESRAKILKRIDVEEFDKLKQWMKLEECGKTEMKKLRNMQQDEKMENIKELLSLNETEFNGPRGTWIGKTNKIKEESSKLDAEKRKFDGHVGRTTWLIGRILFIWKNAESFFHSGLLFTSEYENHKLIWLYLISGIGSIYFAFWSPVCTMLFTKYQLDGYWVKLMRRLFYLNAISAILLSGYEIHSTFYYKCSPIMLNNELDDFYIPSYNNESMFNVKDVFMKCVSNGQTLFSATNNITMAQKTNFTEELERRLGDDSVDVFEQLMKIDREVMKPNETLASIGATLQNITNSCPNSTGLQPVLNICKSMKEYVFVHNWSGDIEDMKKDAFEAPMQRMHQFINTPVEQFNEIVKGTDINCSQFHDAYMHGYKWSCTAVNQVVIDHLKLAIIGCSAILAFLHMFYLRRADNTQFWNDPRVRWAHQFMTDNVDDEQYREWLTINNENPPNTTYEHFAKKKNWKRNRFGDLGLIDQSRVVLTNHPTDYIHASWIPIPGTNRRYIATQAPLENTFKEFWHMVVQEEVKIIVMLTAFIEMDHRICDRYFPFYVGDTIVYDHFEVTCLDRVPAPKSTGLWLTDKRTLKLIDLKNPDAPPRFINHIFFKRWFTEVIPKGLERVVDLQRYVESLVEDDSPILVHCSNGIDRTGIYICLDYAHALIVQDRFVSMVQVVNELAQLRWGVMGSFTPYLFIFASLTHRFIQENYLFHEDWIVPMKKYRDTMLNRLAEQDNWRRKKQISVHHWVKGMDPPWW